LPRNTAIPVVTIDENVGKLVASYKTQSVLAPFHQMAMQVLLGNEVGSSARYTDDPHEIIDDIDLGLIFESSGEYIDHMTQLSQFSGKLNNIDHLPASIRCAERRVRCDVTMRRYQDNPRKSLNFF
jgi:hypothetical protein